MKTQNTTAMALTIALTLVAGALVLWQTRSHDTVPPSATSQSDSPDNNLAKTTAVDEFPAFELGQTANSGEPRRSPSRFTDAPEKCKWGSEYTHDEETGEQGWQCTRSGYWNYTTATLEGMAYADPEAARVLAHRLKDTDYPRALKLAVRSVALSGGDVLPLLEARYWRPLNQYNGDADISGIGQAYVLLSLADKIRTLEKPRAERFENRLRHLSDDSEAMLLELDEIVHRLLEETRTIEKDITGNSTIGGDSDA